MRGFTPWPDAYTQFRSQTCHLRGAPVSNEQADAEPGTIVSGGGKLRVACGQGSLLELNTVKLEGRKQISAAEFANGARLQAGERFGQTLICAASPAQAYSPFAPPQVNRQAVPEPNPDEEREFVRQQMTEVPIFSSAVDDTAVWQLPVGGATGLPAGRWLPRTNQKTMQYAPTCPQRPRDARPIRSWR